MFVTGFWIGSPLRAFVVAQKKRPEFCQHSTLFFALCLPNNRFLRDASAQVCFSFFFLLCLFSVWRSAPYVLPHGTK